MIFSNLKGDRPIGPEVRVRPVEPPKTGDQAHNSADKWSEAKRILRERKRRRYDPDERNKETDPRESEQNNLPCILPTIHDADCPTSTPMGRTNGDRRYGGSENHRLCNPGIEVNHKDCAERRCSAAKLLRRSFCASKRCDTATWARWNALYGRISILLDQIPCNRLGR